MLKLVVGLNARYENFIYLCIIFVIFFNLFFVLTIFILLVDSSSLASPYKRCATFVLTFVCQYSVFLSSQLWYLFYPF